MIKTFILSLSLISSALYAAPESLDHIPNSKAEFDKMVRINRSKLAILDESIASMKETSKSAIGRSNLSRGIVFFGSGGIALSALAVPSTAITLVGGVAAPTYVGTAVVTVTDNIYREDSIKLKVAEKILSAERANNHIYSRIQVYLDQDREQIINEYFDGSFESQLKNGFTLGGLVADGTVELYVNLLVKREFLEREYKDLMQLPQ